MKYIHGCNGRDESYSYSLSWSQLALISVTAFHAQMTPDYRACVQKLARDTHTNTHTHTHTHTHTQTHTQKRRTDTETHKHRDGHNHTHSDLQSKILL
jgi:hypothetical protein